MNALRADLQVRREGSKQSRFQIQFKFQQPGFHSVLNHQTSFVEVETNPPYPRVFDSFAEVSDPTEDDHCLEDENIQHETSTTITKQLENLRLLWQIKKSEHNEIADSNVLRTPRLDELLKSPAGLASPNSRPTFDAWKQLEHRFISAMNEVAALLQTKNNSEHLSWTPGRDRRSPTTIMYQHQRKQQKVKIQEG